LIDSPAIVHDVFEVAVGGSLQRVKHFGIELTRNSALGHALGLAAVPAVGVGASHLLLDRVLLRGH